MLYFIWKVYFRAFLLQRHQPLSEYCGECVICIVFYILLLLVTVFKTQILLSMTTFFLIMATFSNWVRYLELQRLRTIIKLIAQ